ncbi:hypothetical protein QKU58_gp099 [Pyramimonas orientalis virus]|uniref:Bacteriophage/plasmid primase P4 C-terminal domain-containing protein n=1 Tax=Pyramimonas orientalis virus 01B TaxID=3134525 RepID=A0A7M3UNH5_9VIRU|nr:hypothetical protein QKU58_gp099 [Pyramimonas orientalis virus]QOI90232.1 hypothetical protein HWQ62_00095 [Pyramimonas orientalis virus]
MSFGNRSPANGSKELAEYVYNSLDGTIYDIAQIVFYLYKDIYKVALLKTKLWYAFDGLKWVQSELGPYYELSENVVEIYQNFVNDETEKKVLLSAQFMDAEHSKSITEHEQSIMKNTLKKIDKTISKAEKIIQKLKNVNSKEAICKECLYLFYDPDFLCELDTDKNLICFLNGILDLKHNVLRAGLFSDNISIVVNVNFVAPKTKKDKNQLTILLNEFEEFRDNITLKRENKLIFKVK